MYVRKDNDITWVEIISDFPPKVRITNKASSRNGGLARLLS